jgi:uncharacterized protein YegL
MDKELTELVFILDRSGSMSARVDDVIGGVNELLNKQRVEAGRANVTVAIFDDHYDLLHDANDLRLVAPLSRELYFARGSTALQDAIARTIDHVGRRLVSTPDAKRPAKILVTIMTDGLENASVEYGGTDGLRRVKDKIKHQQDKYNWVFAFVGANMDAVQVGGSYGIHSANAMSWDSSSPRGLSNVMRSVSSYASSVRSAGDAVEAMSVSFNAEDRERAMEVGDTILGTGTAEAPVDATP